MIALHKGEHESGTCQLCCGLLSWFDSSARQLESNSLLMYWQNKDDGRISPGCFGIGGGGHDNGLRQRRDTLLCLTSSLTRRTARWLVAVDAVVETLLCFLLPPPIIDGHKQYCFCT
jgi:hypothetical protein